MQVLTELRERGSIALRKGLWLRRPVFGVQTVQADWQQVAWLWWRA